ncbi:IS110 family transposase [Paraflavitalea sp. CAU 1676]|uniref:IS110 family transposase n=1 Tax=Paraflavitalea sp. CAU 1676 TaxID=3032598 RepID=UPI0023DB7ADC|nr:IS110 family transposase [Paraflavitalea sp. CAU 1676]MDF2193793.1 IS110 family transposase [Paraflavitalea sp. CAU 1676]
MNAIIRQCVGIDIAKLSFTACLCRVQTDGRFELSEVVKFDNSKQGFNQLIKWVRKQVDKLPQICFVMEATGIYYEPLAYHLTKLNQPVSVVLPNKVKHYAKSLNIKSKTDTLDARTIARMGAERPLELWQPPAPIFKELRDLCRLYTDLKIQRTAFINRLKSTQSGNEPLAFILDSTRSIIRKLDNEIVKCAAQIQQLLIKEEWLEEKVNKIQTIKGVGFITIAIILAETQGFRLIKNGKQLTSYAGYDIVEKQSGSSIKGKTRISKKGNGRIRAALHFPALVASRYNQQLKAVYTRINEKKECKMVGATALQRKILLLIYTLWKNDSTYQENYSSGNQETKPLLRHKDEVLDSNTGRPISLPAQDELPSNLSTEALLRQI